MSNRPLRVLLVVALLLSLPTPALADWFLGLGGGVSTSASTAKTPTTTTGQLGVIGDGWLGFEFDYGFLNNIRTGINGRTFTAGLLVGRPFGRLRPYGTIGGGVMGGVGQFKDIFVPSDEAPMEFAIAAGGGVFADLSDHFGLRADVRSFMGTKKEDVPLLEQAAGLQPKPLKLLRASGGIVFKF